MGDEKKRGSEAWDGGYIRRSRTGKATYIIRRRVAGRLYEVSTRCSTLRAAMVELARWEADPGGYVAGGKQGPEPVTINAQLAQEFLTWSSVEKRNGARWVREQAKHLEWWRGHLRGVDLRAAPIEKIEAPLKGAASRRHRIEVIKAFYGWLVSVKRVLKPDEDPTFRTLKVPQARPEQAQRAKAYTQAEYLAVRDLLLAQTEERGTGGKRSFSPRWIDALDTLAGTGWHVTELERFSEGGSILALADGGAVLTCPEAKSGVPLRTTVGSHVADAATRIRAHGKFRGDALRTALQRTCKRLKVPVIHPGSFRHSVATHAISAGVDLQAASTFLGHRSEETTKRFYATHAVPKKVPTLM